MKSLIAVAAVVLATTAAQAGESYSFDIGGRTIHIEAPTGCNSPSCVSVSIPGVYESGPRHRKAKAATPIEKPPEQAVRAPPAPEAKSATPLAAPPASAPATAARSDPSLEPANGAPSAAAPVPSQSSATLEPKPPVQEPRSGGLAPPPVVASAPAASTPNVAPTAEPSPVGIWLTEEKEGRIRIEPCGANLCGFSIDKNEKILVNMKPSGGKWMGRIHDPKSGSDYDSTIALRGPDKLRVQGCAFGGMFCGGQTWTRVN